MAKNILQGIQAMLFDLDGTLIQFNVDQFFYKYTSLVSQYFRDVIPPQDFIPLFLKTGALMRENDGLFTNIELFISEFSPQISLSPVGTLTRLMNFYSTDFDLLQDVVAPEPLAIDLLHFSRSCGFQVVIATEPVFPEIAIKARLKWATNSNFKPDFITSAENMHSCKNNVNYYDELCSVLDLEPEQCLMIGNSIEEDIVPAAILGMKTFLVISNGMKLSGFPFADISGSLADLLKILKTCYRERLREDSTPVVDPIMVIH